MRTTSLAALTVVLRPMRAAVALAGGFVAALVLVAAALSVPPTLTSVGVQDRHPLATFSAPKSDFASIDVATRPDRATDGSFLNENVEVSDILTASEIQAGRWAYESQIAPGTYYVLLLALPDVRRLLDLGRGGLRSVVRRRLLRRHAAHRPTTGRALRGVGKGLAVPADASSFASGSHPSGTGSPTASATS